MCHFKHTVLLMVVFFCIVSCKKDANETHPPVSNSEQDGNIHNYKGSQLYADFESILVSLHAKKDKENYTIVENPSSDKVNPSSKCGAITLTNDIWDFIYTAPMDGTFDLSKDTIIVSVKVYSEVTGKVNFKFESSVRKNDKVEKQVILGADDINKWVELTFQFKKSDFLSNGLKFNKLNLLINADGSQHGAGNIFYFDDIRGPILNNETVFRRFEGNPYLKTKQGTWYSSHIANISILPPSEATNNKWLLFARGSSKYENGQIHGDIGVFYQDKDSFSPTKGWITFPKNPILPHGFSINSQKAVLGTVTMANNNKIFVYYRANKLGEKAGQGSYNGAVSMDGGHSFIGFVNNPLLNKAGPMSTIFHNGKYYFFFGNGRKHISLVISDKPNIIHKSKLKNVISIGDIGSYDGFAVAGAKIFRVKEDDKWFMIYQCSYNKGDFPNRFHAAYSEDLIHWTKVDNEKPLFYRGDIGQWDQGAIWTGKVIEYEGKLYIYYEGWGKNGAVKDRNKSYFKDGKSQVGIAIADVDAFLNWCEG